MLLQCGPIREGTSSRTTQFQYILSFSVPAAPFDLVLTVDLVVELYSCFNGPLLSNGLSKLGLGTKMKQSLKEIKGD